MAPLRCGTRGKAGGCAGAEGEPAPIGFFVEDGGGLLNQR